MEIKLTREALSQWDLGGAYREVKAEIFIDGSLPMIMQMQSLVFEILSLYLDPMEKQQELINELASVIAQHIDELEGI